MPASLQLGQQHMSQLPFIANDPCESLHSHPALPVLLRSDNEHMNVGLLLPCAGYRWLLRSVSRYCCLPTVLRMAQAHPTSRRWSNHPPNVSTMLRSCQFAFYSLTTNRAQQLLNKILFDCLLSWLLSELWLHLLDKNCELKDAKKAKRDCRVGDSSLQVCHHKRPVLHEADSSDPLLILKMLA